MTQLIQTEFGNFGLSTLHLVIACSVTCVGQAELLCEAGLMPRMRALCVIKSSRPIGTEASQITTVLRHLFWCMVYRSDKRLLGAFDINLVIPAPAASSKQRFWHHAAEGLTYARSVHADYCFGDLHLRPQLTKVTPSDAPQGALWQALPQWAGA